MLRSRPSPSMIVACGALFVALGGTGIAASRYVITSPSQIKPGVLSALASSSPGAEVEIVSPEVSLKPGQAIGDASALCPKAGAFSSSPLLSRSAYHLVTGGYVAQLAPGASIVSNKPSGTSGWTLLLSNRNSSGTSHARAFALCAPGRIPFAGAPSWSVSSAG